MYQMLTDSDLSEIQILTENAENPLLCLHWRKHFQRISSNMEGISSDLVSYPVCYLLAVSSEVLPAVSPSASLF